MMDPEVPAADSDRQFWARPENQARLGMTNLDNSIDDGLDQALRDNPGWTWGAHYAWDHYGPVWFADGMFHEEVRVYGATVARMSAPTLRELMDEVNARWGRN